MLYYQGHFAASFSAGSFVTEPPSPGGAGRGGRGGRGGEAGYRFYQDWDEWTAAAHAHRLHAGTPTSITTMRMR
ncbi:MAG: hypothetical protein WDO73_23170 [Ignavibacteriota bacterium]